MQSKRNLWELNLEFKKWQKRKSSIKILLIIFLSGLVTLLAGLVLCGTGITQWSNSVGAALIILGGIVMLSVPIFTIICQRKIRKLELEIAYHD